MKAKIDDGLYSFDIAEGPPALPDCPNDCWVNVIADVGHEHAVGGDMFLFSICTVTRLKNIIERDSSIFLSKVIIVERFDWKVIEDAIKGILDKLEADTWEQLAAKINEYGEWEFHDYNDEPIA